MSTQAKQSAFARRVEHYLVGLTYVSVGACPGCDDCGMPEGSDDYDTFGESHFSWSPCECCDSSLGGDRSPAHAVASDGSIVHMDVCTDCVMYLANGDEPSESVTP